MKVCPIFICKANVGRSQIAEGIFNHLYGSGVSVSMAGSEARKERYLGVPDSGISKVLKEYKGIDISNQKIKYLKDISVEQLSNFNLIMFLFDPVNETSCEDDCKLNGITPYEYFKTFDIPMLIHPVIDPFDVGSENYKKIIDEIEKLIKGLSLEK